MVATGAEVAVHTITVVELPFIYVTKFWKITHIGCI